MQGKVSSAAERYLVSKNSQKIIGIFLTCSLVQASDVLGEKEVRVKLTSANFTQKLFVEMTRFLLVLIEKFPIAEARLTCLAFVF